LTALQAGGSKQDVFGEQAIKKEKFRDWNFSFFIGNYIFSVKKLLPDG
jgi:hypothetical protein